MAKTILIVEDDPNISELVQMYLEKEGYHTKIAADGGQGVALFRQVKIATAATVDAEGPPQARIINVMLAEDDGMYIVTSRGKPFYKQLEETGEIALAAGFTDPNYFIRFFRRRKGVSPGNFRKQTPSTVDRRIFSRKITRGPEPAVEKNGK